MLGLEDKVHRWATTLADDPSLHGFWLKRDVSVEALSRLEIGWDGVSKRYSIPVRGAGGELLDVKKYRPGATEKKNIHTKGFGRPTRLWGADRLAAETDPARRVIFCAGEPDAILLTSLGFLAVTGTSGEGSVPTVDLPLLKSRHVVVCYDTDGPGQVGAEKILSAVSRVAASVERIDLPFKRGEAGKDVTDWFALGHTPAEFRALARPLSDRRNSEELLRLAVAKVEKGESRNDSGFWLAVQLRDERYTRDETTALGPTYVEQVTDLRDKPFPLSEFHDNIESAYSAEPRAAVGSTSRLGGLTVAPPTEPMTNARAFHEAKYSDDDGSKLVRALGSFYAWTERDAFQPLEQAYLDRDLRLHFEDATYPGKDGPVRFNPTNAKVAELRTALESVVLTDGPVEPNRWLSAPPGGLDPADPFIPCRNGILHVPSRSLVPPSPAFFAVGVRPLDYDADAAEPVRWLRFMEEVMPEDPDAVSGLQEWFGYVLGGLTDAHKMVLLVGTGRSGKGTVARVLGSLIGDGNVAWPTMASLGNEFGLQSLIGKSLAVIPDARTGRNNRVATERLLSVVGGDPLDVNRKYRDVLPAQKLSAARLMMLSNELPTFDDASAAVVSRFLVWEFTQSFLGREDWGLAAALDAELAGILNWALEGLDRVLARGRLLQHASGRESLQSMSELASPVKAFLAERWRWRPPAPPSPTRPRPPRCSTSGASGASRPGTPPAASNYSTGACARPSASSRRHGSGCVVGLRRRDLKPGPRPPNGCTCSSSWASRPKRKATSDATAPFGSHQRSQLGPTDPAEVGPDGGPGIPGLRATRSYGSHLTPTLLDREK